MRAMYPRRTRVSVKAGRSRYSTCVPRLAPGSVCAVTGSQPSHTAKTRMRKMPDTNSGIAEKDMLRVVMPLSVTLP